MALCTLGTGAAGRLQTLNPSGMFWAGLAFVVVGLLLPRIPDKYFEYTNDPAFEIYTSAMKRLIPWIFIPLGVILATIGLFGMLER